MTNRNQGCFLAFEGIDGSGKSTQIELLRQRLERENIPCVFTREPTDFPVGALLRRILTGGIQADPRVVAALFTADRLDHLLQPEKGVLDIIRRGSSVVTDRYYFSSYAYQSVDVPMDRIIDANAQSAELLRPAANIFIDVDPDEALQRIAANRDHVELFETRERLTATREKYFEAFGRLRDTERVLIFDGSREAQALSDEIWEAVKGFF